MERYELVDINGNKTGKVITNIEAQYIKNVPDGYYLSVVGVIIVNSENKTLLQKRSRFKLSNPSKWGICGGKVNFGETTLDAAIRETKEEIGVEIERESLKTIRTAANGKSYFTIYYIKKDVNINECKIQKEELEELKYFKIEELQYLDNEGFEWLERLKEEI